MDSVTTTLRIKEYIKIELDKIALNQNRSLNNLIETILIKYLENYKKEKQDNEEDN